MHKESEGYIQEKGLKSDLDKYCRAYHTLLQIIPESPQTFLSGHAFPFIESYEDLEKSYQLACFGFYKASYIALRSVLELGLLQVYWNRKDEAHIEIGEWVQSKEDTPYKKVILAGLLSIEEFKTFQNEINIVSEIEDIYTRFSNYVHTKGARFSSRANSMSNFNTFNELGLKRWINLMKRTVKVVVTAHILKYPVSLCDLPIDEKFGLNTPLGLINPYEAEHFRCILDEQALAVLQRISDNSEYAQGVSKWVNSHPDITQDEFDEQALEQEKHFIESMGFNDWFRKSKRFDLKLCLDDSVALSIMLKQVIQLKTWAKQKNFMEPKVFTNTRGVSVK